MPTVQKVERSVQKHFIISDESFLFSEGKRDEEQRSVEKKALYYRSDSLADSVTDTVNYELRLGKA
jgi:hypothetical protein